jgi:hypothetical protein
MLLPFPPGVLLTGPLGLGFRRVAFAPAVVRVVLDRVPVRERLTDVDLDFDSDFELADLPRLVVLAT